MGRVVTIFLTAVFVSSVLTNDVAAKSKNTTSKTRSKAKASDSNVPKKNTAVSEAQLKETLAKIEKYQNEASKRHEELLKELYSLRAFAIKEHASETTSYIDDMIEKEKQSYNEIAPPGQKEQLNSAKSDDSNTKGSAKAKK